TWRQEQIPCALKVDLLWSVNCAPRVQPFAVRSVIFFVFACPSVRLCQLYTCAEVFVSVCMFDSASEQVKNL
ncbi:MAG: hypothetical protein ACK55Z_29010, partial [bacterium]